MAEQEAQDNAAKKRIVDHMNADHHDSLIRFMEHYCSVPSWIAYDAEMTAVDLNGMSFTCGNSQVYRIPFEPPMSSYREARERAVAMDKESLEGLDKSDVTVKEFVPPRGLWILEPLLVAAAFAAYSQRWWFGQGQIVEQYLGSSFAAFCWTIQPWLISAMLAIHCTEAFWMARNYLRKHSVNIRDAIWWQWVFCGFIEGITAFWRFQEVVRRKRAEKEKQKH